MYYQFTDLRTVTFIIFCSKFFPTLKYVAKYYHLQNDFDIYFGLRDIVLQKQCTLKFYERKLAEMHVWRVYSGYKRTIAGIELNCPVQARNIQSY